MEINYPTKFARGERVNIVSGFYRGTIGVIESYSTLMSNGMRNDHADRGIHIEGGVYDVKIGRWKRVTALEYQLELEAPP